MKNKKQQLKSALSTLALALALAGNLALPDDGIRPLIDIDKPKTTIGLV